MSRIVVAGSRAFLEVTVTSSRRDVFGMSIPVAFCELIGDRGPVLQAIIAASCTC